MFLVNLALIFLTGVFLVVVLALFALSSPPADTAQPAEKTGVHQVSETHHAH